MENKFIMDTLVAIKTDISTRNPEGAYGRCAVLFRMLEDEIKLKEKEE